MKKLLLAVALAAFMTAGIQGTTFAQGNMKNGMKYHHGQHKQQFAEQRQLFGEKLNLTEAQRAKVKEMREDSKSEIKSIFEQIRIEKQKFKDMQANNASQEELKLQKEKMHALIRKAQEIRKQNMSEFEKILTPEQKAQFTEIKKQKHEMMKQKHEKMKQYRDQHKRNQ